VAQWTNDQELQSKFRVLASAVFLHVWLARNNVNLWHKKCNFPIYKLFSGCLLDALLIFILWKEDEKPKIKVSILNDKNVEMRIVAKHGTLLPLYPQKNTIPILSLVKLLSKFWSVYRKEYQYLWHHISMLWIHTMTNLIAFILYHKYC